MNKQIRKLVDQAGFIRFSPEEDPHTPIDWSCDYTEELNRFAELIVKECAEATRWQEHNMSAEQRLRLEIYQDIKKHFGVEE
jgi:hypothetical protein